MLILISMNVIFYSKVYIRLIYYSLLYILSFSYNIDNGNLKASTELPNIYYAIGVYFKYGLIPDITVPKNNCLIALMIHDSSTPILFKTIAIKTACK